MPKTMSLRFSSNRQGTISNTHTVLNIIYTKICCIKNVYIGREYQHNSKILFHKLVLEYIPSFSVKEIIDTDAKIARVVERLMWLCNNCKPHKSKVSNR